MSEVELTAEERLIEAFGRQKSSHGDFYQSWQNIMFSRFAIFYAFCDLMKNDYIFTKEELEKLAFDEEETTEGWVDRFGNVDLNFWPRIQLDALYDNKFDVFTELIYLQEHLQINFSDIVKFAGADKSALTIVEFDTYDYRMLVATLHYLLNSALNYDLLVEQIELEKQEGNEEQIKYLKEEKEHFDNVLESFELETNTQEEELLKTKLFFEGKTLKEYLRDLRDKTNYLVFGNIQEEQITKEDATALINLLNNAVLVKTLAYKLMDLEKLDRFVANNKTLIEEVEFQLLSLRG